MSFETNLGTLYQETRERFRARGIENPGLEASVILCSVTGQPAGAVHTKPETVLKSQETLECENRVKRRLKNEPCAYTTGVREFFSRCFSVSPAVLIPRSETETVVEAALEKIPPGKKSHVVDVGTGSGCIAVTLKKERPDIRVAASDISAAALKEARRNAHALGADISFILGDTLSCFGDGCTDMVISNPPYVSEKEFETLPEEVRGFEPALALLSGEDGFEHTRKIVLDAPRVMRAGGCCIVEVGDGQAQKCAGFFEKGGFSDISTLNDIHGKARVVTGIWKK